MSVQELQKFTAISKYARWLEDKQRREVWGETVARYRDMMVQKHPHREGRIREVAEAVERFEVMPSMRGLQFGGKPIFQHNGRIYNCTGSYCDRLRFFSESFYLLLCGSGVGFSVQDRHIRHLPKFSRKRLAGVKLPKKKFVVPDTIEGWADTSAVLLSSYHAEPIKGFEDYHDAEVIFDYSQIREENAPLSFGIGRAPGPMPLRKANLRNRDLLNRAIAEGLVKLNSIYAYDYAMHDADAVVSGGVRRSATIVLFDLWDQLMMTAKVGNWRATNPQRGRSNNSVILIRGESEWEDFLKVFEATRQWGEPGFYWTDHPDGIPNPCVEIGFYCRAELDLGDPEYDAIMKAYQGPVNIDFDRHVAEVSGWQCCNLSSINCKLVKDEEDFFEKCEQASDLGTWQASFNKFPYLGRVTERIVSREALLGVSLCGVMHKPDLLLRPDVLREGARRVIAKNEIEARLCGINPCARGTCTKPDGNLASLLGSFSGIHGGKFVKGFRHVQVNKNELPYQFFRSKNPLACEPSRWSTNHTDDVIKFCVKYEGKMESSMTAVEFLDYVKLVQQNWVVPGKVESRCVKPWSSHNVSNTVRVRDDEWDSVAHHIFENQSYYSGVSFIGVFGDRDFTQAPFTSVLEQDELIGLYGANALNDKKVENLLLASGLFADLWDACDLVLEHWGSDRQPTIAQANWALEVRSLADAYFDGDVRKATYLLKDVYNANLYRVLEARYVPVDYSEMVETTNTVNLQQEIACAGGACEL